MEKIKTKIPMSMKRNKHGKRLLSFLLVFVMVVGLVPFGVFAPNEVKAESWPGITADGNVGIPGAGNRNNFVSVIPDKGSNGGYVMVGKHSNQNMAPWSYSGSIAKISPNNTVAWAQAYGVNGTPHEGFNDVAETPSGNFVAAGALDVAYNRDLLLVEYNQANGSVVWQNTYAPGNSEFTSIAIDNSGNIIAAGYATDTNAHWTNNGGKDGLIVKLNPAGNIIWGKSVGTAGNEEFKDLFIDSNGNYVVCGTEGVISFSPSGSQNWAVNAGSCNAIAPGPNGSVLAANNVGQLTKIDSTGGVVATAPAFSNSICDIASTNGSGYIAVDGTENPEKIVKYNEDLTIAWSPSSPVGYGFPNFNAVTILEDGTGVTVGNGSNAPLPDPEAYYHYWRFGHMDLSVTATPTTPVFITAGNLTPVTITPVTENSLVGLETIEPTEWFRVSANDPLLYNTDALFDAQYALAAASDKGTLTDPNTSEAAQPMPHPVDKNATYWYKGRVLGSDGVTYETKIKSIKVKNIMTQSTLSRKGEENGVPSNVLYAQETTTMDNSSTPVDYVTNKVGVAYDLDGTTILSSTSDGITLQNGTSATVSVVPRDLSPYWQMPPAASVPTNPIPVNGVNLSPITFKYNKDLANWANITVFGEDLNGNPLTGIPHSTDLTPPTPDQTEKSLTGNIQTYGKAPFAAPPGYTCIGYYIGTARPTPIPALNLYDPDNNPLTSNSFNGATIADVQNPAYTITFVYSDQQLGQISGRVMEETVPPGGPYTIPIPGARVETSTGEFAITDANGNYTITNVPLGTHNVIATHPNYNSAYKNNIVLTPGVPNVTVNFALEKNIGGGGTYGEKYIVRGKVTEEDGDSNPANNLLLGNTAPNPPNEAWVSANGSIVELPVDSKGNYVAGPFDRNNNANIEASAVNHVSDDNDIISITADILGFDFALRGPAIVNKKGIAAENEPPTPIVGMLPLYNANVSVPVASTTFTVVPDIVPGYVVVGHKIDGGPYIATHTPQTPPIPVNLLLSNAAVPITQANHTVEFYYKVDDGNLIPDEEEMITITVMTDTPNNGLVQYIQYEVFPGTDHVVYAPYMLDNSNNPYVVISRQINTDPTVTSGPDLATQVIQNIQDDKVVTFTYNTPLDPANLHDLHIYTTTGTALDFTSAASIAVENGSAVDAYPPMIDGYVVVYYEIGTTGSPFTGNNLTTATSLTPVNFPNMSQDERILFYYLIDGDGNRIPDDWEVTVTEYFENGYGMQIPGYPSMQSSKINFDSFTANPPEIPDWLFASATLDNVPIPIDPNTPNATYTFSVTDQDAVIRYTYRLDPGTPRPPGPDIGNPHGSGNPDPSGPDTTIIATPKPTSTEKPDPVIATKPEKGKPKPSPDPTLPVDEEIEEEKLNSEDDDMPELNPNRETFMKVPNMVQVKTGEYVDYTLSGIGNPYSATVQDYAIGDNPPEGLTFVEGYIPPFAEGEGLTYKIVYETNLNGERVLYEGLDATQEFSFKAPKLKDGEYINGIYLIFDEVPVDFGFGNTITYTFQVTETEIGTKLNNKGFVSFMLNGQEMFMPNEGNSTVTVYDSLAAKPNPTTMGIRNSYILLAGLTLAGASILLLANKKRKRG